MTSMFRFAAPNLNYFPAATYFIPKVSSSPVAISHFKPTIRTAYRLFLNLKYFDYPSYHFFHYLEFIDLEIGKNFHLLSVVLGKPVVHFKAM